MLFSSIAAKKAAKIGASMASELSKNPKMVCENKGVEDAVSSVVATGAKTAIESGLLIGYKKRKK